MTKFFTLIFVSLNIYCAEQAYSAQSFNIIKEKYPYIVVQDEKSGAAFVNRFNNENSFSWRIRLLINFFRSGKYFVDTTLFSLECAILANELIMSGYLSSEEMMDLGREVIQYTLKEARKEYNPNKK